MTFLSWSTSWLLDIPSYANNMPSTFLGLNRFFFSFLPCFLGFCAILRHFETFYRSRDCCVIWHLGCVTTWVSEVWRFGGLNFQELELTRSLRKMISITWCVQIKKLSGSCISKEETIIIIHVELRWKSQSFFTGSQVSSSRKLRSRKLQTSETQTSNSRPRKLTPRKLTPRKLWPLDETIDILKRSFEWIFTYDNDRDSPQVSNNCKNSRLLKKWSVSDKLR